MSWGPCTWHRGGRKSFSGLWCSDNPRRRGATDDHGGNQALDAAGALVRGGATVEVVAPERTLSPDLGSLTASGYANSLAENGFAVASGNVHAAMLDAARLCRTI
ncbi:hypothetical protein [Streptomyces rapamycinicus]|uniref:N-methylproline demethylase n=2 Tax=Streptomyces rapamycinicus TaxID=1226757 RepID=A0A3L8RA15_STRRN|nr:hypothetical protein [Streptomyces rapamycinicus]MBB4779534.1 hypothetical protein [Streptomyces rapamycinicus]RLV75803.1 N-methylproline demethylase [Streptomyces rapamycinicus NRRL 5491]UTP28300.1 hypothetical protein LIV37_02375 [Streptomyces rapamycinicus NRRL 5491]